jgi:hypothetical protein
VKSKEGEHECNPDDIATAELLAKDTKTCPKCSTGIFKIAGCDVMFCTDCKTSFSWKTGKILSQNLHNPHLAEWLASGRQPEREIGDARCGMIIDDVFFAKIGGAVAVTLNKLGIYEEFMKYCEGIQHTNNQTIERFRTNEADNRDIRMKYLSGAITKDRLKELVLKRQKLVEKKNKIIVVIDMYIQCQTEIAYRVLAEAKVKGDVLAVFSEAGELKVYCNEQLKKIGSNYNNRAIQFGDDYRAD